MDTAQWPLANSDTRHLEIALVVTPSMEEMHIPSGAAAAGCAARPQLMERRPRPQKEHALSCPRCQSTNTKFCYYNNYSLTQPRYFCKTCRRYWTEGGSLRNVPVGGGSRKNKRPSSSSTVTIKTAALSTNPTSSMASSSATSAMKLPADLAPPPSSGAATFQNPKFHEGQDLNLAFPQQHVSGSGLSDFPNVESSTNANTTAAAAAGNPSRCSSALNGIGPLSHMELLRSEISAQGASPFMSMMASTETGAVYPPVLGLQDFRSAPLGFSLDAIAGSAGYGNVQGVQEGGSRLFFPFEELRQVSSAPAELLEQNRVQGAAGGGDPAGFWNGVMGGGSGSW